MLLLHEAILENPTPAYVHDNMEYTGREHNIYFPKDFLEASKIYQKFKQLKSNWVTESGHLANPQLRFESPYYQEILAMGKMIAPILLNDLIYYKADWFEALANIYGIDPVKAEHYGNMSAMIDDWKNWRKQNIHIE